MIPPTQNIMDEKPLDIMYIILCVVAYWLYTGFGSLIHQVIMSCDVLCA